MHVTLENLKVRLGRREVLQGLTWNIAANGRTLLLGRNGAGKTTTLRVLAGGLRPKSGRILLDGSPATSRTLRQRVAMMPQRTLSIPGLKVVEQVALAAWLGGLPEPKARRAAERALKEANIEHLSGRSPASLSGGELRRVGLAEALARPGEVLLLDEPTAGLDPTQRSRFRDLLLAIDRPAVVSTHQLDDVDDLFTYVAVLADSHIVFSGSIAEYLARGLGQDTARRAESAFIALTGL